VGWPPACFHSGELRRVLPARHRRRVARLHGGRQRQRDHRGRQWQRDHGGRSSQRDRGGRRGHDAEAVPGAGGTLARPQRHRARQGVDGIPRYALIYSF
jgi:hypothetical protein